MTNQNKIKIAICVATYQRKELLSALLSSIIAQEWDSAAYELNVIVVDNDIEESARTVCEQYRNQGLHRLQYLTQKQKGISLTRNVGVQAAIQQGATWLVLLDDDEVAHPDWLQNLLHCQQSYQADVVYGPVLSAFPEKMPKLLRAGGFLQRRRYKTGTKLSTAATGNVLFHKSVFEAVGGFDPYFQLSGGEDHYFFSQAHQLGFHMVFCDEAILEEVVPECRTNWKWLTQRNFRIGNSNALVLLRLKPGLKTYLRIFGSCLIRLVLSILYLVAFLLCWRASCLVKANKYFFSLWGGLFGALNVRYNEYE